MKNVKLIFSIIAVGAAIMLFSGRILAQPEKGDIKLTCDQSWRISPNDKLKLETYDSDIAFSVWDKNEVRVQGELVVNDISKEDQVKLSNVFSALKINQSSGVLEVDTKIIESSYSVFGSKTKIELNDGSKISVKSIKISYKVSMPASMSLNLSGKYHNISIESIKGDVDLDLYDCDVTMSDFGNGTFDTKYSKVSMGNGGDCTFTLYDTDVNALSLGDVKIDTKYGKFSCEKANSFNAVSYDDDFVVKSLKSLSFEAKYSSFKIESDAVSAKFDLYDSDIFAKGFKSLDFKATYSDLNATNIDQLNISSSYDNNYYLGIVNDLSCNESKYDQFKIDGITTTLVMPETYEPDLTIKATSSTFKKLSGKFTYGQVTIKIDPTVQYSLNFKSTYGDISFPKEKFKSKSISEKTDSERTFEGSTSNDTKCEIKFSSYSTTINIE